MRIVNPHEKQTQRVPRPLIYTWGNGDAIVQVPRLSAGRTGTGTQGSPLQSPGGFLRTGNGYKRDRMLEERGTAAPLSGSWGRWAPPSDPECRREEAGTEGGVRSAGPSAAPGTGSPRAGLAAGTGWRVPRRLNLQEDILIRSRLRRPSAAAGGRAGLLPAPLPPGPGGTRNRDGGSRNRSPRAGAAARGRGL